MSVRKEQEVAATTGFDPGRVDLLNRQWERLRDVEKALANGAHFADDPECHPLYPQAVAARQVLQEIFAVQAELIRDAWGALNFILAFYEPGQRYLDTEAWKCAEARGRSVRERLSAAMSASDSDTRRMVETGTGSGRSPSVAVAEGQSPNSTESHNHV